MLKSKLRVLRCWFLNGLFVFVALGAPSAALAQDVPHSTVASPDIYKVIAQNEQFQVISAAWKPGQRDAWHSHKDSGIYFLTPCNLRLHMPDGKSRDVNVPVGAAAVQKPVASHIAENIGNTDCKLIMFEPK